MAILGVIDMGLVYFQGRVVGNGSAGGDFVI